MSADPPIQPVSPPPSPYYASSSSSRYREKYDEKDYEEVYYHFDDYCQDIILANASRFLVPPEPAEHYEWEEVILEEMAEIEWEGMKKSLYFGLGCGLLSFGMLRWRRGRIVGGGGGGGFFGGMSKYASSSSASSRSGGYTFDPLPPKSTTNAIHTHHYQHQHRHTGGNSGSGLIFDMILSTFLGLGTSVLAIESGAFFPTTKISDGEIIAEPTPPQWISPEIPLVPGRSNISDTLCAPLTEEFRKFPKGLWQSGNNLGIENGYNNHMALYANSGWKGTKYYKDNDNASILSLGENDDQSQGERGVFERLVLDNLQGFIINCERRARQERKLRKIRGLRKDAGVVIPEPEGVVCDEDLSLDDVYLVDREEDDDDRGGFGL